jgi:hypothetical protein
MGRNEKLGGLQVERKVLGICAILFTTRQCKARQNKTGVNFDT